MALKDIRLIGKYRDFNLKATGHPRVKNPDKFEDLPSQERGRAPEKGHRVAYRNVRKFLHNVVGRPWAEIHAKIRRETTPIVQQQMLDEVVQNVQERNGCLGFFPSSIYLIDNACEDRDGFTYLTGPKATSDTLFVHPKTGLLCVSPKISYRRNPQKDPNFIHKAGENFALKKINGIWFRLNLMPKDEADAKIKAFAETNRKSGINVHISDFTYSRIGISVDQIHGMKLYVISKKSLNHEELHQYGLKNENAA